MSDPSSGASVDRAERIPYGEETRNELSDGTALYIPRDSEKCHDCRAERGELHTKGCDVEQCPECGTQLISCEHGERVLQAGGSGDVGGVRPAEEYRSYPPAGVTPAYDEYTVTVDDVELPTYQIDVVDDGIMFVVDVDSVMAFKPITTGEPVTVETPAETFTAEVSVALEHYQLSVWAHPADD